MKRRMRGAVALLPLVVALVLATGGWALASTGDGSTSGDTTTTTTTDTQATADTTTTTDPSATADPSATTDPSVAPDPSATGDPSATADPTASDPTATGTLDPSATGDPSVTSDPTVTADPTGSGTSQGDGITSASGADATFWVDVVPSVPSVPPAGNNVLYTYTVHNDMQVALTITSLKDTAFGVLDGDHNCQVGTVLDAGTSCSFDHSEWLQGDPNTYKVNTFTAVAEHGDTVFSACETALVRYGSLPSGGGEGDLTVHKTAARSTALYTGENMKFWFTISNGSTEDVTITSIVDDVFGPLPGDSDCKVGTLLYAGDACTFSYTSWIEGPAGSTHVNTVTVVAEAGKNVYTASDSATVTFVTGDARLEVRKTANKHEVPTTGGKVIFTFDVMNTGEQDISLVSMHDDVFGALAGDADCHVGTVLAPHTDCTFTYTTELAGPAKTHHVNTVTVVGKANGHFLTACDTETVTFIEEVLGEHGHKPKPPTPTPTAFTGASLGFAPPAALVLLVLGAGLLASVRRRRTEQEV
jgi:hypothetical protein